MKRAVVITLVVAGAAVAVVAALASRSSHRTARARTPAATWADVAPIFAEKCASCHRAGGIAPFSITTARSAAAHADAILAMTQARRMPPWMPGPDSPRYVGERRRVLTATERQTIARWVRAGAHVDRGRRVVPARAAAPRAGAPLTLEPAHAYYPKAPGGGLDDYHCFLLEPHLTHDVYVTSALVQPRHSDVVHHVILFEAAGENARIARALNRRSGGDGWSCFGGPGLSETRPSVDAASSERLGAPQWIGAWVPGHLRTDLPAGTGVLLHAGAAVVMQVHYNLIHPAKPDRTHAVLRVTRAAGSRLRALDTMLIPAPVELPCPAGTHSRLCSRAVALRDETRKYGAAAALIPLGLLALCGKSPADYAGAAKHAASITTSCERRIDRRVRIYGVAGHMHLRGVDIRVELDPGTARARTLLHIPRWSFHWQDAYYLARPVDANPGDTVGVSCRFANDAAHQPVVRGKPLAPRYVLWGEGTTDEMCLGLLQLAAR